MGKVTFTVSIESRIAAKIHQEADREKSKSSHVVNFILEEYFKNKDKAEQEKEELSHLEILTCPKDGCRYSSKMQKCPQCATKEAENELANYENAKRKLEKADSIKVLFKKKEPLIDAIRIRQSALSRMEQEGRKEESDRIKDELEDLRAELKKVNDEILDLQNEGIRKDLNEA